MLLHEIGKPTKTLCCQCHRLFEPTDRALESVRTGESSAFLCKPCDVEITERFRYLNAPKKRGKSK